MPRAALARARPPGRTRSARTVARGVRRRAAPPLDLAAGTVSVRQQHVELDTGELLVGPPKSRAGVRTVAIPEAIISALRDHLDQFTAPEVDALIFTGSRGGILRRSNFRWASKWDESTRKIGFPGLHFHDLRHAGDTIAASSGASLKDLMQRMGHDSVRAALIYQHSMGRLTARSRTTPMDLQTGSLAPAIGTLMARSPVSMIGNGAVLRGGRYWVRTSDPSLVSQSGWGRDHQPYPLPPGRTIHGSPPASAAVRGGCHSVGHPGT
ncbi:tyrosine-type recombinase/integrase [Nonomuraea sp. NPDC050153]|uniref:tyrosine-type recombinase/integrase n=1 Tax=Nonomuraea sp. NPDC050153 TaxID=3364359 RepID=UPI0037B5079B